MTKADIVAEISKPIGIDKANVLTVVELLMSIIKDSLANGEDVTLRSFGLSKSSTGTRRPVATSQRTPPSSFVHSISLLSSPLMFSR